MTTKRDYRLKWISVESSAINAVAYNSQRKVLHIEFHTGVIYSYLGIGRHRFKRLINAESVGKYFNEAIRPAPSVLPTTTLNEWERR